LVHGLIPYAQVLITGLGKLGLAVVSEHALNIEGIGGPLVKLDVQGFPLESCWNIVYPKGKTLSVLARKFLSFLKIHGGDYLKIG
jgi:DNA-binding transcriptional LysR family regulator